VIPAVIPPLTGLTVLVTRPAPQAAALCARIAALGGNAIAFPALEIEALPAEPADDCDLAIFASVNAVEHGVHLVRRTSGMRIAAIGKATAAALAAAQCPADLVPEAGFNSEALLAHPQLQLQPGARVLIVRGTGGRELLQDAFAAQGMIVTTRAVYRRRRPQIDANTRDALEQRWREEELDVVTATSVETLDNLIALLSERGRDLLRTTAIVVASRRIMTATKQAGLEGQIILAGGADDESMVGALTQWHARARER
jgi:uroporphyrinogen-III synthase